MNLKKYSFVLIAFLLSSLLSFSQGEIADNLPDVKGPSPDVAALAKYIDFPVNYAAGIPNIEIPIYTVSEGSLSVPISLNYHAGGVKVTETATSVGLGWSLNAGGVVSRMIKHHPDDMSNIGYMDNEFYSSADIPPGQFEQDDYFKDNDTEPDIFFFNFMGHSGKFQYSKKAPFENKFFHLKESNIKINFELLGKKIDKFILTTPDGTKYIFGKNSLGAKAQESTGTYYDTWSLTSSLNLEPTVGFHVTAWYLMEIESVSGQRIQLSYEGSLGIEATMESQKYMKKKFGNTANIINNNDFHIATTFSKKEHNSFRISSITSTYNRIDFEYDTQDREDFQGNQKLNKIKIKIKNNLSNEQLKEFVLNQDYFESSPPGLNEPNFTPFKNSTDPTTRFKRLRLNSITERGYNGTSWESLPPYAFEYNGTDLPHKFSFAQDLWGYYNGKDNNRSLIPKAIVNSRTISQNPPFQENPMDADRSVDVEKAKAGILEKITYPTGGFTKYNYEVNTLSGILINDSPTRFLYRSRLNPKEMMFVKEGTNQQTFRFTIGESVVGNIFFKIDKSCEIAGVGCFELKLYNSGNQEINQWELGEISLEPGEYTLIATPMIGPGEEDFTVTVKWEEDPTPYTIHVGGLRVKEIIKNDGNEDVLRKTYNYSRDLTGNEMDALPERSNVGRTSSGNMGWWPQVVYDDYTYSFDCNEDPVKVILMTSYPQKPLFEFSGSSTIYNQVTERTYEVGSKFS